MRQRCCQEVCHAPPLGFAFFHFVSLSQEATFFRVAPGHQLSKHNGQREPLSKSSNKIPGLEFTGPTWARWPALYKSLRPKRWNMLMARLREHAHLGAKIDACWEGRWVTAPSWAPWIEWMMSCLPKKEKSAKVKRSRSRRWPSTTFQGT